MTCSDRCFLVRMAYRKGHCECVLQGTAPRKAAAAEPRHFERYTLGVSTPALEPRLRSREVMWLAVTGRAWMLIHGRLGGWANGPGRCPLRNGLSAREALSRPSSRSLEERIPRAATGEELRVGILPAERAWDAALFPTWAPHPSGGRMRM